MSKKNRLIIFNKFSGKCYLCGDDLKSGWHADHLIPCRRRWKIIRQHWADEAKTIYVPERTVPDGYDNPEANHIDNMTPACASCNINKHDMTLEQFRSNIAGFMKHLNEINTQYKIAKRYKLIIETDKPVVFYFETLKNLNHAN